MRSPAPLLSVSIFGRSIFDLRFSLAAIAAIAALVLGLPSRVLASPLDPQGQDWEGLSQLVRMAEAEVGTLRVAVPSTLPLSELRREDGLLLVHPTRALDVDELSAFMRAGGRLVLLDDYGTGDDLLARFSIRRVPLPKRPASMLRDKASFAIAEPASVHPTVRDAARVVTNHATGLAHPALSPLLVVRGSGEPDVFLAMAGAVGHGRLIAVGDASIAMNAMLRYPGNRGLARALVRYLVDDDVWGKRGGKLYVLANAFETTGSFGNSSRAAGVVGDLRRALLDEVETVRHAGMPPAAAYVSALALGLGVLAWTSSHVGRTHRPSLPRFARPLPTVAHGGIAGHAAVLGAPETSRILAVLELKSALEEELATRLGLERTPGREELVGRVRAARLLDDPQLVALSRLLNDLGRIEAGLPGEPRLDSVPPEARSSGATGIGDARVMAIAARVREVLDAVRAARAPDGSRDRVGRAP